MTSSAPSSTLLTALGSLNERDQEVLVLVAWDGLDRAQAAEVLGISAGAFAVRLHRGRRRLVRQRDVIAGQVIDGQPREACERISGMEAS